MAIIIKSNTAVSDPENKLPVYTEFGVVESEVGTLLETYKSMNYTPPAEHVAALSEFVKELKGVGLWDKTIEAYPIMGNNMQTAGVKLKTATESNVMQPVGQLTNDAFEYSGDHILGKKLVKLLHGGLNTGLKGSYLTNGFGIHAYVGESVPIIDGNYNSNSPLWGASYIESGSHGTFVTSVGKATSTPEFRVAHTSSFNTFNTDTTGGGVFQAVARPLGAREVYFDGDNQASQSSTVDNNLNGDRDLYLFARNGFGSSSSFIGHYYPAARFVLLTDGSVTREDNAIIEGAINKLMQSMGRSFA